MHRRGGKSFSPTGRRKNSAVGNSRRKNTERRSPREDCVPERREKIHRRQTEHQLSSELRPFWKANNPGRNCSLRCRQRPIARGPRLDGNHNSTYCGRDCHCRKVPRASKFISRDDLWLWRASPCATSRALSHPFTPKSLRIRYQFKRIVASRCTTIARTSDRH